MLLKYYGPYFTPQPWNCFHDQGFAQGPLGPLNHWYTQVPVNVSHLVNHVQHFAHIVECFFVDNL